MASTEPQPALTGAASQRSSVAAHRFSPKPRLDPTQQNRRAVLHNRASRGIRMALGAFARRKLMGFTFLGGPQAHPEQQRDAFKARSALQCRPPTQFGILRQHGPAATGAAGTHTGSAAGSRFGFPFGMQTPTNADTKRLVLTSHHKGKFDRSLQEPSDFL